MPALKSHLVSVLRWSERYTKTDMVYLLRSGFWTNLGSVGVSFFSFFLYLAFAHFLPKEVYGTYQYLLSIASIVGAFTLTGMNSALTRAVVRGHEGTVNASVPLQLKWGILPLLGAWAGGGYYLLHGNMTIGYGLLLIGIFVPFNNALNSYSGWIGGRKDFKTAFTYNLFTNILFYPALIITAFFSKAALALLAANFISQCIGIVICYRAAEKKYQPNDIVDQDTFTYGKHLSLMGIFGAIVGQIDSVLAFHLLGAAPLAVYNFATAIPDRIASLLKFIPAAAFPKLVNRTPAEIKQTLLPRLGWALAGGAFVAFSYMLIARTFFAFFFPAYATAVPYSMLYALAITPAVSGIFPTALTAHRSVRALYIFNTVMPIISLTLMATGTLWLGLYGLIAAKIAAYTIQFLFGAILFFYNDSISA